MKKILFVALLTFSTSTFADVGIFQKMKNCTILAVQATQFSFLARTTDPKDESRYQAFTQAQIDANTSFAAKNLVRFIADFAWNNKDLTPDTVGMAIYSDCTKSLGKST